MTDEIVEPEGSLRIVVEEDGIEASVSLFFVFDGDWSNVYNDEPATEAEARQWFVGEFRQVLERVGATRHDDQTERPSDSENRGA